MLKDCATPKKIVVVSLGAKVVMNYEPGDISKLHHLETIDQNMLI